MKGRPFEPGNKMGRGRPPGSRNKRTEFQKLMEDHGEALIKQCQVMALKGDPTAMRLCMERLFPPAKPFNSQFRFSPVNTAADLVKAVSIVRREVARGRMSAQEGEAYGKLLEIQLRMLEDEVYEKRLQSVEDKKDDDDE
jgi:hypothetical protein